LIFLDFRAIVTFGSIKVEQRVDESPLFLVGNQQERVTSGGCALARMEDVAKATALGTRVLYPELDDVGNQQERVTSGGCALARMEDVAKATALGTRVLYPELDDVGNQQERVTSGGCALAHNMQD